MPGYMVPPIFIYLKIPFKYMDVIITGNLLTELVFKVIEDTFFNLSYFK